MNNALCNLFISMWTLLALFSLILVYIQPMCYSSNTKITLGIGVFVWLAVTVRILIPAPFSYLVLGSPLTPSSQVPNVFFVVFITHTMLPLSRRLAVVLATLTALCDLVISALLTDVSKLPLVLQVRSPLSLADVGDKMFHAFGSKR